MALPLALPIIMAAVEALSNMDAANKQGQFQKETFDYQKKNDRKNAIDRAIGNSMSRTLAPPQEPNMFQNAAVGGLARIGGQLADTYGNKPKFPMGAYSANPGANQWIT